MLVEKPAGWHCVREREHCLQKLAERMEVAFYVVCDCDGKSPMFLERIVVE